MINEWNESHNDAELREVIAAWTKALHAKDVDALMIHYAPDILLFDLAPPLQYRGAQAYKKNWEEWFPTFQGAIGYEVRNLRITAGDEVAFSHSLNRISGKRTNGEETEVWVRATMGFRKIEGKWLITHEHVSVPFDMVPPYCAALNLKP